MTQSVLKPPPNPLGERGLHGAMRFPKIPWKRVADYIWHHGGSYHFGNATCKKKWWEVQGVQIEEERIDQEGSAALA
jgi:hypothetical protein